MQIYTSWDMFDLLGLDRRTGEKWQLYLDYLGIRGPGGGTEYEWGLDNFFGIKAKFSGDIRLYGMLGHRGRYSRLRLPWQQHLLSEFDHRQPHRPPNRPVLDVWTIEPSGIALRVHAIGQFAFLSDRNFLEEFYMNTWLNTPNQDTYLNIKQQQENWNWSLFAQARTVIGSRPRNGCPASTGICSGRLSSTICSSTTAAPRRRCPAQADEPGSLRRPADGCQRGHRPADLYQD